jgi:predicted TIM-barrel fold metal-dependent hydrolase
MIWDSHVHLKHGDAARTEYSAEQIVEVMDAAGIERSVVFAISTTTRRSIEMAAQAAARFPDRLIPYAYALPSYERAVCDELEEALSTRGLRGIKIHAGECTLAEHVVDPVLAMAGRYGAPCLIDLAGNHVVAESMARRFPHTKLIIAHLGRYLCEDEALIDRFLALAEQLENVFLDASGVVMVHKIAEAVERIGARRVIWGSDGPAKAPDLVSYAESELDKVRSLRLGNEAEQDVLGRSLQRLLGM